MPRKLKLDNMKQTHGKIENPVTLEQLWGDDGSNKYGTLDADKYSSYINGLNKSDLQKHAVRVGLVPIDDRTTLIARLKKEFSKHVSTYSVKKLAPRKDISKKAKDILSEGR